MSRARTKDDWDRLFKRIVFRTFRNVYLKQMGWEEPDWIWDDAEDTHIMRVIGKLFDREPYKSYSESEKNYLIGFVHGYQAGFNQEGITFH